MEDLDAVGIPYDSVDSEGEPEEVIHYTPAATPAQILQGNAIAAAHNPNNLTVAQLLTLAAAKSKGIKAYMLRELRKPTPAPFIDIFNAVKGMIETDNDLYQVMVNLTGFMNGVFGWSVNPNWRTSASNPAAADRDNLVFIILVATALAS